MFSGTTSHGGRLRDEVDLPGELGRLHLLETTLNEDGTGPRIGVFHDKSVDYFLSYDGQRYLVERAESSQE